MRSWTTVTCMVKAACSTKHFYLLIYKEQHEGILVLLLLF